MDTKQMIRDLRKSMLSEVNEGEFYILNNKNRALIEDSDGIAFTDNIGSESVKSWKRQSDAEKFCDSLELEEGEVARVVAESDVCSHGYYVNDDNAISPVYTLNTLLNRATNERYHKNIIDAQFFVDDAPNREQKKEAKKVKSAVSRLAATAKKLGLTPEQLIKQMS